MQSISTRIETALAAISNHKPIAQKSPEWLAARKNLIAASESGYLLGIKSCSSMINYIKAKCNLSTSLDNLSKLDSIRHGNVYEDVSRAIYQSRHSLEVKEYGLLTTSKNSFLGASPDGIVIHEEHSIGNSIADSRIGRLVEIKNPYDYDPSDVIKPEYAVQILQQQFVLDLPKCDFVKTNIIGASVNAKTAAKGLLPYRDIDAFLADVPITLILDMETQSIALRNLRTLIKEPKVPLELPQIKLKIKGSLKTSSLDNTLLPNMLELGNTPVLGNLSSKGMEKGIIIYYKDLETGQYITHLYPLDTPYTKASILEWIKTTKETISSKTGICKTRIAVEYWYLAAYFEKTLDYDSHLFENIYLPRLELVWQLIMRIRQLQALYSSELIINFIDNILKPHIHRPSAFYKLSTNQMDICNLLETSLQLDVKQITHNVNAINTNAINDNAYIDEDKVKSNETINETSNGKRINKTSRTSIKKVVIEYDF